MEDFRHKDADLEFRRGLEELFRGHLDGCMSAAFSSSCSGDEEEEEDNASDLLARRRRRSDLESDDLAESSAAARRQSRILGRWVARQAEEMITSMEQRTRESELMALAGLHTVSTLDSSFLHEPRRSPSAAVERPVAARSSSILQLWRERVAASVASESQYRGYNQWDNSVSREESPEIGDGGERERERERVRRIVRGWMMENAVADAASRVLTREESPRVEWLGEIERERVRLVREWVQMTSQPRDARTRDGVVTDHVDGLPEHTRMDLPRIRGRQARLDVITRMGREREGELQSLSEHRAVSGFGHRNRIQVLLRGRFLRNGSSSEEERPTSVAERELGQLRQQHHVSGLRLENGVSGLPSNQSDALAAQNIDLSRNDQSQTSPVVSSSTAIQEIIQSRSESADMQEVGINDAVEAEMAVRRGNVDMHEPLTQVERWQEEDAEHERRDWQQSSDGGMGQWHEVTGGESDGNWQENAEQEWIHETAEDVGEDGHLPEVHEEWHDDEFHNTDENWQDNHLDPPNGEQFSPRSINTFMPPDDDNVYSMELRELLSRRSVSNLLHSGFRQSLDQLIRSYVQRQGHVPINWDLESSLPTPNLPEENQALQRDDENQDLQDSIVRPRLVIPPPPLPPRQPLWHSQFHHNNWSRRSMRRSEIEWDAINDLRSDMNKLQQGMSHVQRTLEACMDMQLELQRSIRQEVSAALNRFAGEQGINESLSEDGTKWSQVRKGICCVCCDAQIDSLLYRCGHMCTCSKCANELVRGGGKCPLCRAPIVEVVRAYSMMLCVDTELIIIRTNFSSILVPFLPFSLLISPVPSPRIETPSAHLQESNPSRTLTLLGISRSGLSTMVLDQKALCKRASKLEYTESKKILLDSLSLSTLNGLLLDVYDILRPRPLDYEQRINLLRVFNMMATDIFGDKDGFPMVEAFGSFAMDLFTARSDLDLSVNFDSNTSTEFPRDKKISVLRKFARVLYTHERRGQVSGVLPIMRARVPVLKVIDCGTGIECDISVENKDGITRSMVVTLVSSIDERFRILSYLMKCWARAHNINSSKDRTMSSMSIITLVAFHLQTRNPPILPPFSVLLKDGSDASSIQNNILRYRGFGRGNQESVAGLFVALMNKLSSVESLWQHGLCASTFEASWISKTWDSGVGNMSVEDFLDRSQNFARSIGKIEMQKICKCIRVSLDHLSCFMIGQIEASTLRVDLFGSLHMDVPVNQLKHESLEHKRRYPIHPSNAPIDRSATKKARHTKRASNQRHACYETSEPLSTPNVLPLPLLPFQPGNVVYPPRPQFVSPESNYQFMYYPQPIVPSAYPGSSIQRTQFPPPPQLVHRLQYQPPPNPFHFYHGYQHRS
ncbi:uncharacterized protein [Typha angustifolia]|uniref:uncharacterized protein n=1 Tax=Typha angustifolia TaxID=59011 RepID=UPI003C2C87C4